MGSKAIHICIVFDEAREFSEAKLALSHFPEFSVHSGNDNLEKGSFDALLVHWSLSGKKTPRLDLLKREKVLPLVYYGPTEAIRISFSQECSDFISYPFNPDELAARLFRVSPQIITVCQNIRVTLTGYILSGPKNSVKLSNKERAALLLLSASAPVPVARKTLLSAVFPTVQEGSRYPDIIMSSLRSKIRSAAACSTSPIQAAWGYGYRL